MLLDISLLIIFSVFVIVSFIKILKQSILFGGLYIFMYIYSIFAQIGYCFFPEVSEFILAYFGKKYFYSFYIFNFLSFLTFYILFISIFKYIKRIKKYEVIRDFKYTNYIFFLFFLLGFLLFEFGFFMKYNDQISYANASDEDFINSQGIIYRIFIAGFKFMVPLCIILYAQVRIKATFKAISYFKNSLVKIMFVFTIVLFVVIANQLGNRQDIVATFLGILVFEYKMGFNKKKIVSFFVAGILVLAVLLVIESTRTQEDKSSLPIASKILLKDYYAPAHILYAAMAYNYIHPGLVLVSNFSNTLIALNKPYLQSPVTDLFNPGVATRSAGYAFYLFSEGFMFMGYWGFVYNGFMLMTGITVWNYIQNSTNRYYNYIILAIMSTQFANISRSQSSYFYKDLYMYFLPALVMLYLSSGFRPKFLLKKHNLFK